MPRLERGGKEVDVSATYYITYSVIRAFCVSVMVALGVGAIIVSASRVPFLQIPFLSVERAGLDLGMAIAASRLADRGANPHDANRSREPRYVFLDIKDSACKKWLASHKPNDREARAIGPTEECVQPASPRLMLDLAIVLFGSTDSPRPLTLVLDTAVTPELLLARPLNSLSVPVITVANTRTQVSQSRVILQDLRGANASKVSRNVIWSTDVIVASGKRDGDSVFRRYAATRLVDRQADGGLYTLLPSVGFAVAAVARDSQSAFELFRQLGTDGAARCDTDAVWKFSREFSVAREALCTRNYYTEPTQESQEADRKILFSVPSLSPPPLGGATAPDGLSISGKTPTSSVYVRLPIDYDGSFTRPTPDLLNGAVVIIGSSDANARDWHQTPLGTMTGPELIVNAARSFMMFDTPAEELFFSRLTHKSILSFECALLLLPCWILVWTMAAYRQNAGPGVVRATWSIGMALVFFAGTGCTIIGIGLWITEAPQQLKEAGAVPADVLTPALAVALEGFAEGAVVFIKAVERQFDSVIAWARGGKPATGERHGDPPAASLEKP